MIEVGKHMDVALGRDKELGLSPPSHDLVPLFVRASQNELCRQHFPKYADMTDSELHAYVDKVPRGRCRSTIDKVPIYWFWLVLFDAQGLPEHVAGDMNVNISLPPTGEQVDRCHFGYHVLPQFRGRHLAARAIRLALTLLRLHGVEQAWITCHPSNVASRRTCEIVGARLFDIIEMNQTDQRSAGGDQNQLCRYVLKI